MKKRRSARLRLALAPALLALAAADQPAPVLREQAWTYARGAPDLARALTQTPGECLSTLTPSARIGRALFRAPALLGGPAARAGLSCNACHADGRVNERFLLPELTDRPGAADVTSEWASRTRGDGAPNPVDIPDLAGVGVRSGFGRARDPSLEHFVRGVVVEEFQGQATPAQAMKGLLDYLRALDAAACPTGPQPITLALAAEDVHGALDAATNAEDQTARLLLLAAQDAMGRIAERLPSPTFAPEHAQLEALARELGAMRASADLGAALETSLPGWRARFDAAVAAIAPRESRTYFNEAALRAALDR